MNLTAVRAAMQAAFDATGAAVRGWPDPHPEGVVADDEYSRCLDPRKYLILAARVDAWAQAVTDLGLATAHRGPHDATAWAPRDWPRTPRAAIRLRPVRRDALPITVALYGPDGRLVPFVDLGAGDPAVLVRDVPRCGCDACDSGSHNLLYDLDEVLGAVVAGTLVHVASRRWTITSTGEGWSGSGDLGASSIERELAIARAGVSRHHVTSGEPWWT